MRLNFCGSFADKIMMIGRQFLLIPLLPLAIVLIYSGCGKNRPDTSVSVRAEANYCSNSITYSSPATITGTAKYQFRTSSSSGLGGVDPTPKPIRFAEVVVYNEAGAIAQCAETDGSGNFSFQANTTGETWTVKISSRANNSQYKASILNNPTSNTHYTISTTFTPDSSKSVGTITAPATGTLEGGAFNILDKILDTNQYLVTKTASCASMTGSFESQSLTCTPYTPTFKVNVYWTKGFNPNSYLGDNGSGLSFYVPSQDYLYILGGISGDTDSADTDHFDSSIIIHEYGHFIEAHYSTSDSPGGGHSGTTAIDARLAWSEGWANFLQAAVTGVSFYRDTVGNISGSPQIYFNVSTEYICQTQNIPGSGCFDKGNEAGEGNFREFGITRSLYDAVDATNAGDDSFDTVNGAGTFDQLWAAFTALKTLSVNFRSFGLFQEVHAAFSGSTSYTALLGSENQVANRTGYATKVQGGACTTAIPKSTTTATNGSGAYISFDYWDYIKTSNGTINFTLNYSSPGSEDMDLFIMRRDHNLFNNYSPIELDVSDMVLFNDSTTDNGSVSLTPSLAIGHYLVVVQYYTGAGSINYTLTAGGAQVCP
ncbi:MAG: hypothetical protein SGJ18_01485 [Pseudomonadota bacterium]|nr:hypothetical protein [Pseudomonadota bacterium]